MTPETAKDPISQLHRAALKMHDCASEAISFNYELCALFEAIEIATEGDIASGTQDHTDTVLQLARLGRRVSDQASSSADESRDTADKMLAVAA